MTDSTNQISRGIPSPRKARLKTAEDCRRFLAKIINEVRQGELDPTTGGRLGYLTNILVSCIRDSDLEARLAALEAEIGK